MIRGYLRKNLPTILFGAFTVVTFLVVAILYVQLWKPILYATLIVTVVGVIFLGLGYMKYRTRISYLKELSDGGDIEGRVNHLQDTTDLEIAMYQDLLRSMSDSYRNYVTKEDEKYRNRTDYFGMWAHQIKTPISAMHLLIDEKDLPEEKNQLFWIEEYVSMVMHYLKADDITKDFVLQKYAMDPIIQEAVRHFSSQFIHKKIKLEYDLTNTYSVTDKKWILFVIEQILSNSLKYTEKGSIRISAEGKNLVITDTGCGIAPEDIPRLGDKGYTGYNGRMDSHSSGLGLYLCRLVLSQLGHTITFQSTLGKGTSVIIGLDLTTM